MLEQVTIELLFFFTVKENETRIRQNENEPSLQK